MTWTVPALRGVLVRPRDRAVERPVDLDRRVVELEALELERCGSGSMRSNSACGAGVGEDRARRARCSSPPAVRTPAARPPRTTIVGDLARRSDLAARGRSRATSASVIRPAPPRGTGQPSDCPMPHSTQPYSALPAESGVTSACSALPASRRAAPAPRNSSSAWRRSGSMPSRAKSSAALTSRARGACAASGARAGTGA